jgi:hypothetical protein
MRRTGLVIGLAFGLFAWYYTIEIMGAIIRGMNP